MKRPFPLLLLLVLLTAAVTSTVISRLTVTTIVMNGTGFPTVTLCNASPPTAVAPKGSLCIDVTAPQLYQSGGTGTWTAAGGGGGGLSEWSAGTYAANSIVTHTNCSWLFAAKSSTAVEPCWDLGDGTSGALWAYNNVASTSNGVVTLIQNVNGQAANIISLGTWPSWQDKEVVVDAEITGSADALGIGIFNGSLSSTQAGAMVTGSYGAELDMYNSQVQAIVNGGIAAGSQIPVRGGWIKNTGTLMFDRWYVDFHNDGLGHLFISLWRNHMQSSQVDNPYGPFDQSFGPNALKRDLLYTWNETVPSFSTFKVIVSARTGGANGLFKVNKIQVRDVPGAGTWKSIAPIPDL